MKIAHVSLYPPRGEKSPWISGVAWYERLLMKHIPHQSADEVFVLCNKLRGIKEMYTENGITFIRCFDRKPQFVFQIFHEIKKIRPDVIHIQQELGLFGGIFTAYLLQWLLFFLRAYPVIITLHGVVSLKKVNADFVRDNHSALPPMIVKFGLRIIYRPLCLWSQKVIVHEKHLKHILIQEYKAPEKKVEVIHLGIEDLHARDRDETRSKLQIDPWKNVVLFMGYATGYKGIDLLLEGFSAYASRNHDAYLIIGAGKHPKLFSNAQYLKEYERLQQKARDLIPKHQYHWVGFIPETEIVDYYSASDVSIYPYTISMSSSGPMAFAIGYEKPFLASDVFAEAIEDENFLFQMTPESLAAKLEDFFQHKENFQQKIKQFKKERLWTRIGRQVYTLYQSLF